MTYADEVRNHPGNSPDNYSDLSDEHKEFLAGWIGRMFKPSKRVFYAMSSYGIKHVFERSPGGFYITNGQFKGAMKAAGHAPVDDAALNWRFRVSARE